MRDKIIKTLIKAQIKAKGDPEKFFVATIKAVEDSVRDCVKEMAIFIDSTKITGDYTNISQHEYNRLLEEIKRKLFGIIDSIKK